MTRLRSILTAIAAFTLTALFPQSYAFAADCGQWDLSGRWEVWQTNNHTVRFDLSQNAAGEIRGTAVEILLGTAEHKGSIRGNMSGVNFSFVVEWQLGSRGEYKGKVNADDWTFGGTTLDLASPQNAATWYARGGKATCKSFAAPGPSATTTPQKPVKTLGKKLPRAATAKNDVDIYNGAGGQFQVIGMLRAGTTAPVTGRQEGWFRMKVNVPGGYGWIASDHLALSY